MPRKKSVTEVVEKSEVVEEQPKEMKMAQDDSILELDMNLEDYADFEPLPKGPYPATCVQAERRTSDKGNDYYYTVWTIHPDDYPADYARENNPEGTRLNYSRVQVPDAKNRRSITAVKNLLRAIGISTKTNVINCGEWEGKKAKLIVDVGEFNGMPNNQIASIEALD